MVKAFCYRVLVVLLCCLLVALCSKNPPRSGHTNNWAVLVSSCQLVFTVRSRERTNFLQICTSRYWFNYRHIANTLSIYHSVKRLGIPDRFGECCFDEMWQLARNFLKHVACTWISHLKLFIIVTV